MTRIASINSGFSAVGGAKGLTLTVPGAPTSVSATALSSTSMSVSFTAPTNNGGAPITSYTVTSSPGSFTGTGSSSPITVTGLTSGVSYTFTVTATNSKGTGPASSASSGVVTPGQYAITGYPGLDVFMYTTSNNAYWYYSTTTWVVPSGVTSISIVTIGGGASGIYRDTYVAPCGGGGGGLAYNNNVTVTPGETLTITYGPGQGGSNNGSTVFVSSIYASCWSIWRGTPFTAGGTLLCGATGALKCYDSGSGSAVTGNSGQGGLPLTPGTGASPTQRGTSGTSGNQGWGVGGPGGAGKYEATPTHNSGGGGAGGYGASGGAGGRWTTALVNDATAGTYGAGGGGGYTTSNTNAGSGGGASIYGTDGTSAGGSAGTGGTGADGGGGSTPLYTKAGKLYGGGGASGPASTYTANNKNLSGAPGAIRIVWPGTTRQFPNTNVGTDL